MARSPHIGRPSDPPGTGVPEISVIVPHLNQPDRLRRLLASLAAQDRGLAGVEVIVVDNGSRTLPRAPVAGLAGAILVEEVAPGPGPARNRGAALARAPILAFTDADCLVAPDWLSVILARFAADPGLAVLGGEIRMTTADPGRPTPAEAYECLYAYNQHDYITRRGFSVTANLAVRRAAFDAVGPFAGIDISEDMDWGARAAARGFPTVYVPEMVIHHPARHAMRDLRAKWDRNISHHYRVLPRGAAGRARWAATALALALSAPAEIPRILRSDRIGGARARAQALRGVADLRLYRARRMLATLLAGDTRGGNLQWNRD
jgi:GT2 family glycosyltransferase